jgi:hypothetical protein
MIAYNQVVKKYPEGRAFRATSPDGTSSNMYDSVQFLPPTIAGGLPSVAFINKIEVEPRRTNTIFARKYYFNPQAPEGEPSLENYQALLYKQDLARKTTIQVTHPSIGPVFYLFENLFVNIGTFKTFLQDFKKPPFSSLKKLFTIPSTTIEKVHENLLNDTLVALKDKI